MVFSIRLNRHWAAAILLAATNASAEPSFTAKGECHYDPAQGSAEIITVEPQGKALLKQPRPIGGGAYAGDYARPSMMDGNFDRPIDGDWIAVAVYPHGKEGVFTAPFCALFGKDETRYFKAKKRGGAEPRWPDFAPLA